MAWSPVAGRLEGGTSGTSTWLLAGRDAAAPSGPVSYDVGGTLRYTVEDVGTAVEVELASVRVTVQPQPQLQAHYFIQRDVISDNPFTTEVRPLARALCCIQPCYPGLCYAVCMHCTVMHSQAKRSSCFFGPLQVEPAVPAVLGLLIHNSGAGAAYDVQMQSLQPEIVENRKGLVVAFNITGAVRGRNNCAGAALTVDVSKGALGRLPALQPGT